MLRSFLFLGALAIIAMAGCSKDESVTESQVEAEINGALNEAIPKCTPGRTVDCPCPMGALGVQTCAADGKSYSACADCWSAMPTTGSSSSSGGGGADVQQINCDPSTSTAVALYPGRTAQELSAVRVLKHQSAIPKQAPFSTTVFDIWDGKVEAACLGDYNVFIMP